MSGALLAWLAGCAREEPQPYDWNLVDLANETPPRPPGITDTEALNDTGWYQACPAPATTTARRLAGTLEVATIAWAVVRDGSSDFVGFGHSTAGVGDVTGDGIDDVAVVVLRDFAGDQGGVDLLTSPIPPGESDAPNIATRLVPDAVDELESWSVGTFGSMHSLPDVTDDGLPELVVGTGNNFADWDNASGAVWVLASPVTTAPGAVLLDDAAWATFLPGYEAWDFGAASAVDDVNGDGVSDLLIGAPGVQAEYLDRYYYGGVFVFPGPVAAGTWFAEDAWEFEIAEGGAWNTFGTQVVTTDLSGDGLADVMITSWLASPFDSSFEMEGAALIWEGPIEGDQTPEGARGVLSGRAEQDRLGTLANALGDTDGDGYGEFGVSSQEGPSGHGAGSVWLVNGMPTGDHDIGDVARTRFYGNTVTEWVGAVNTAGDLDLDGFDDVLVGASELDGDPHGAAYVYYGPLPVGWYPVDQCADVIILGDDDDPPVSFAPAGDLWGDGTPHLILGAKMGDKAWLVAGGLF